MKLIRKNDNLTSGDSHIVTYMQIINWYKKMSALILKSKVKNLIKH